MTRSSSEPPALVVFDLGGTTVYDRGEVPAAFSAALGEAGIPFDPAEPTVAQLDYVYGCFRRGLLERLRRAQPLSLPGAQRTFERLHAADIRVAIASGFDRQIIDLVLGIVGWAKSLDTLVCSEDVPLGRPAPFMIFKAMERSGVLDVHRVAVVGDTLLDLQAGWNAGVAYRVAVLTGAHDRVTLSAGPQTHVVDSVADVPGLWLGPA